MLLQYVLPEANPGDRSVTSGVDQSARDTGILRVPNDTNRDEVIRLEKQKYTVRTPPSAPINNTQDMAAGKATTSQSVRFRSQTLSLSQRKRSSKAEHKGSRRKRMKSSNMVQPIDVGEDE